MSYIVNGKSVKNVGLITEPSSYGLTATPENMQAGTTAVVGGERIEGTGRAFEFALYGQYDVDLIFDENGNDVYGVMIQIGSGCNVVFISSNSNGDMISQDSFIFTIPNDGRSIKIATNRTSSENIYAFYLNGYLFVYSSVLMNQKTSINYFIGKDNLI